MSQRLYEQIVSLFFGFVLLVISTLATMFIFLLSWYVKTESVLYAFLGAIFSIGAYGCLYFLRIRNFKENIGLYIPKAESSIEFLEIPDDKALAVCTYYHNGASLEQIKHDMGFNHANQVKRHLLKGLDILLREHKERKVEK